MAPNGRLDGVIAVGLPEQIALVSDTLATGVGLIVIAMAFEVAVFETRQLAFEVSTHVTT